MLVTSHDGGEDDLNESHFKGDRHKKGAKKPLKKKKLSLNEHKWSEELDKVINKLKDNPSNKGSFLNISNMSVTRKTEPDESKFFK
jgi:hypothetical protein